MTETQAPIAQRDSPYFGLDYYDEQFGAWFFGREAAIVHGLYAGAGGLPFTALPAGLQLSDVSSANPEHFHMITDPFTGEQVQVAAPLRPDVALIHVQRADADGNAHCWGNFGVMLEGVRAAKNVIVVAEEVVSSEIIASDPNRTVIPGFLVNAVVECRYGAHPSPVQGYYMRDDAFFRQYHEQTKTKTDSAAWQTRWVRSLADHAAYVNQLGARRVEDLHVKQHAYAAQTDYGY